MDWRSLLGKAITVAVDAHRGQTDRYGAPYILHPLRVMARVQSDRARIVAILHDVVEDTACTLDDLREQGFPEEILKAVDSLTKRSGEEYETLIKRAAENPLARAVKVADLEDNMDLRRMPEIKPADLPRLQKYLAAWNSLNSGDQNLQ